MVAAARVFGRSPENYPKVRISAIYGGGFVEKWSLRIYTLIRE